MESTIDSIIQTTKPLLPQLFARTEREKFEQVCQRMQGFSELAQTWRALQELYSHFDTGARHGLGEYVQALDAQFARAFIAAFPSVEYVQDELLQGGLDAISDAKRGAESKG